MKKTILILVAALLGSAATFAQKRALVRLSVVSMRSKPSHGGEQVSQALMGTPVNVLEREAGWSRLRTPDGYEGWIIDHSLVFPSAAEMAEWAAAPKVMITEPFEQHDADRRTDLVAGDVLVADGDSLLLPDGRRILAPAAGLEPLGRLGSRPFRPEQLPRFAELYMGVPYLWGGLSSKGMDCSGLVRMAYAAQGRLLPRDAWQQAQQGREVPADSLRPGDLLFFGNAKTGRITHVAIYDRDGLYVHSSQLVCRNSLDPKSPLYLPLTVLHRRRVEGLPMEPLYR
ncbi:MAG: C40 family peptidase [Muribaculaceae bacterium]|nr:C40 family peptidase [Muribaculaceae bacterium]